MTNENDLQPGEQKKVYETKVGEWFTQDETDEAMGIETMHYENGSIVKKCKLSDGREAVARRLKGKDSKLIQRIADGNDKRVQSATTALCTKIDGKDIVVEDLDELWFNDFTRVNIMASTINFL